MEEAIQTTLFKEEPKPKAIEKRKIVQDRIVDMESLEEKDIESQTYACITITYQKTTNVKGEVIREGIDSSERLNIEPYPQSQSSYGGFFGMGIFFEKEDMKQVYTYLLEFKKRMLNLPYTDDLKSAERYTNLKPENVLINISDKTKALIETETGKPWFAFLQEWNKLKNIYPSEKYNALAQKEYELEKALKEMDSGNGEIQRIENVLKDKLKLGGYWYGSKKKPDLEFMQKTPAELAELLEKARGKQKATKQEKEQILEQLRQEYMKIRSNSV